MSNLYFTTQNARRQVVVRVVEGVIEMFLIAVGIAAVCYIAGQILQRLGVA